ncbi:alpha-L-fucosidase [Autumnicola musiva]|uniref:alpha-L-fucosidase n=1 Tax=Autumnicola musiva TaxID=3075589 RepID=A0ABU3D9T6_9FLAO|nr:alpha-L-fucosidase [Zunongwangia sp. F117]MDT0678110.1 alpha-L-fucosidase [Zunongwangia sp. F117]
MNYKKLLLLVFIISCLSLNAQRKTAPHHLEKKSNTEWFENADFGMFIHFGLYSELGGFWKNDTIQGYAEWIQAKADIPSKKYSKLIKSFNPENFDADAIAKLAKKAGMKYLVVTAKHHEGFCLWSSDYTKFDISTTPYKKDIIEQLTEACKSNGLKFGVYYSIIDWHHPTQKTNNSAKDYWDKWAQIEMKKGQFEDYLAYMKNQLSELITEYDPDIIWFDGDWVDWWSLEEGIALYDYIKNLNPEILVNNRVAKRELFKKDFGTPEQEHLKSGEDYLWEACYTLNDSWGYKKGDDNWKSASTIYSKLQEIKVNGGNLLLNIGPKANGSIPEKSRFILLEVGEMLENE